MYEVFWATSQNSYINIAYMAEVDAMLKCLHELYQLIIPKCISRFEYDMQKFHSDDNNVVSSGGLGACGTGVQFNVASLGYDLLQSIGSHQGSWHPDASDDFTYQTMFVLSLAVGPGTSFLSYIYIGISDTRQMHIQVLFYSLE